METRTVRMNNLGLAMQVEWTRIGLYIIGSGDFPDRASEKAAPTLV